MEYFLNEVLYDGNDRKNAMVKPREDMNNIFLDEKMTPLDVVSREKERKNAGGIKKLFFHFNVAQNLSRAFKPLSKGDVLYIQFPLVEHSIFQACPITRLKKKGVKIVVFVHDLELFRASFNSKHTLGQKVRYKVESRDVLDACDIIVVHNRPMADTLNKMGFDEKRIVVLEIFDYLMDEKTRSYVENKGVSEEDAIVVAGNLSTNKAAYLYKLDAKTPFNLYGVYYTGGDRPNMVYKGGFDHTELPFRIEGRYGLVWDGTSTQTCEGTYGQYLRINNPHKISLYLAMSLPVIIWEEAAMAGFITRNKCGITISSLHDLEKVIPGVTEEEYALMRESAEAVGKNLRIGYYTKRAIGSSRERLGSL